MLLFHKQRHILQIKSSGRFKIGLQQQEERNKLACFIEKDYAGIDPRKFVKSTPNDGLAAGLGHAIFKSGSVFLRLGFSHMGPE